MLASRFRWVLIAAVAACAPLASGCYADVEAEPAMVDGYRPLYYDGYVVYYDDYGRPYYYNNGAVYWIPANHPMYGMYYNHWNTYRVGYRGWYGRYGTTYRGYRYRGGGYRGYRR